MVVALIAGAQDCEDIHAFGNQNESWLRKVLRLKHGIPHHDMYLRTLAAVSPVPFEALVQSRAAGLRAPGALTVEGRQVAFDSPSLRASLARAAGQSTVHMVSAYLNEAGFTLGCKRADERSKEITPLPDLIRSPNLSGAIIAIDAMGRQSRIAATAREAGAQSQPQVKQSQPTLLHNVKVSMAEATRRRRSGEAQEAKLERHKDVAKGDGRVGSGRSATGPSDDRKRVWVLSRDLSAIEKRAHWQDLSGIASAPRERTDAIPGNRS